MKFLDYFTNYKDEIEIISKIVDIFSGIGSIFIAAAVISSAFIAWRTYLKYYKNSIEKDWFNTFNTLYKEFWESSDASMIRKSIFIDETYEPIDLILEKVVNKKISYNICKRIRNY